MNTLKKNILKLLIFIIFLFLLDRGFYFLLSSAFVRLQTSEAGGMINKARQAKADILILGSSRSRRHYDSAVIEKLTKASVFNVGGDGHGTPYVLAVCDFLLRDYLPKLIILEVGPRLITTNFYRGHVKKLPSLAPYIDDVEMIKRMIYDLGPYQQIKYLSRTFRFNSMPLRFLRDMLIKDRSVQGFVPIDRVFVPKVVGKSNQGNEEEIQTLEVSSDAVTLLRETIRSIREKGVQVILVTSPRWWFSSKMARQDLEILALLEKLANEERVPYIMIIQKDYPEFMDSSLFADKWHLNKQGAKIFSRILALRLIEEGYIRSYP